VTKQQVTDTVKDIRNYAVHRHKHLPVKKLQKWHEIAVWFCEDVCADADRAKTEREVLDDLLRVAKDSDASLEDDDKEFATKKGRYEKASDLNAKLIENAQEIITRSQQSQREKDEEWQKEIEVCEARRKTKVPDSPLFRLHNCYGEPHKNVDG
jgi:hypothetical protein